VTVVCFSVVLVVVVVGFVGFVTVVRFVNVSTFRVVLSLVVFCVVVKVV
jgi:hypothetical protein